MSTTVTRPAPTSEQVTAARRWIRTQFPYGLTPSYNPGEGLGIMRFMEENFGPCDQAWTYLDTEILFKTEEDRAAFLLSWGKWDE
jgi:hypothetical protein